MQHGCSMYPFRFLFRECTNLGRAHSAVRSILWLKPFTSEGRCTSFPLHRAIGFQICTPGPFRVGKTVNWKLLMAGMLPLGSYTEFLWKKVSLKLAHSESPIIVTIQSTQSQHNGIYQCIRLPPRRGHDSHRPRNSRYFPVSFLNSLAACKCVIILNECQFFSPNDIDHLFRVRLFIDKKIK
jgi:hypothetical protein